MKLDLFGQFSKGLKINWFPRVPDMPKVYHRKCNNAVLDDIYTVEELPYANEAYFVSYPDNYKVNTYGNIAGIKYTESNASGAKLIPTTSKESPIKKKVTVKNNGKENVFIRIHLAIPKILDDADNASCNLLHFNTNNESLAIGKWNWSTTLERPEYKYVSNNNWNIYTMTKDSIEYNVYVVTYESVLKPGNSTNDVIHQVYIDTTTTEDDIINANKILGTNKWEMLSLVEAVPAEDITDPYTAFEKYNMIIGKYNPFV